MWYLHIHFVCAISLLLFTIKITVPTKKAKSALRWLRAVIGSPRASLQRAASSRPRSSSTRRIRAGSCWINSYNKLLPECDTGGYKQSGVDRADGIEGLMKYTQVKHIGIDFD